MFTKGSHVGVALMSSKDGHEKRAQDVVFVGRVGVCLGQGAGLHEWVIQAADLREGDENRRISQ